MESVEDPEEKPYSDILTLWRRREIESSKKVYENMGFSKEILPARTKVSEIGSRKSAEGKIPVGHELHENSNQVVDLEPNDDNESRKNVDQESSQKSNADRNSRPSAIKSDEHSPVSISDENVSKEKLDFLARKRAVLPRQRKASDGDILQSSTGQKQPLGYYGTMALMRSRKYSDQYAHDLGLGLHHLTQEQPRFSQSWHFDRVKPGSSMNAIDISIDTKKPAMKRSVSQKDVVDGQLSKSFSDIMERYKNARKKILSDKEKNKSSESDSDSDIENIKTMIEKSSFESSLLKVDEKLESLSPGQRLKRTGLSSNELLLKPIEERHDSKDTDDDDVSEEEMEIRVPGERKDIERFSWSGNTDNLGELKLLTFKLHLSPAVLTPHENHEENVSRQDELTQSGGDEMSTIARIDQKLEFIRTELRNMHNEDQILAKKLMYIRKSLRDIRLQQSCEEYQTMMDDTESSINDSHTMESVSSICEVPMEARLAPSLRHHGITKMNISRRRFSVL